MLQELYDKQVKTSIRECKGSMQNPTVYTPNVIDEEMKCIQKHLAEIDAEQRVQNSEIDTLKCGNFDNIKVADTLKVDKIESFSTGAVTFVDPVNIADLTVENFHIQCFCADDTKKFAGQDCDQWKDIINDSCVADACKFSGLSCTEWKDVIATTLVDNSKNASCFCGLNCSEWKDVIATTCVDNANNATCFDNKTYAQVCEDIISSIPPQPYSGEIDVYCGDTCLCTINCENPLVLSPNAFNEYAQISTETYPGACCTGTVVESDIEDFITMGDVDACGYTTCVGTVTSVNACLNGCSATAICDCGTLALDITPSIHFDTITRNVCTCLGDKASNEITLPSGIFCTGTVSMAQSGENSNKPILLRNTQTTAVSSSCCPFTFNPRTGVLVAKCLCGKAQDTDCFNGCTYVEVKDDIRDGLVTNVELESCGYTTCIGTVTQVKVGEQEYSPTNGVVCLPDYPPDLSCCPGLDCTGDVTTAQLTAVSDRVCTIESYIPSQASCTNQLADKEFVNSSIETNTATFRGTFDSVAELEAYTGPKDNNDYAFVKTLDPVSGIYQYDRYKYNGEEWVFEYTINTTGFTAEQLAALNSGITCTLVAKITDVYNCKICIQKNSTCIDSFTLNQSSNKSINITVPTKTSDITNDCSYTSCVGTVTGVTLNNCAFSGTGALSATIKPSLCYVTSNRKLYTKLGNQTSSSITLPAGIDCIGTVVASDIADFITMSEVDACGYTTCKGTVSSISLNGSAFTINNGAATLTNFKPATAGTADNSTCFNGCTYACAKADIRSGLCSHDCFVILCQLCSNLDRNILFSAQSAGCICPVYSSNGVPFQYNAGRGCLRIGNTTCNSCNSVYILCNRGLVASGPKGTQTNGVVVYKENNCVDNCSIGVGIGSGNINRGIFDYCTAEGATSPTFRWLQYWNATQEIHNLPIWGELGANNKVVYSCVAPLPSGTRKYALVCFDKSCTCNPSNSSAYFEIDIYSSKYYVWIDAGGTPTAAILRTYWQTNGIDPNSNSYGSFCAALPSTTANGNCFWITYSAYRAPVIKSARKIYIICDTTTAPEGITFTAPTNRNSYTNVYCGASCICTLQGPANLCLGTLAFSSATIPTKTSDLTNDCGYTTCVGTVTGVSLNGSSFTVGTDGVASLTNFKPATASLADNSTCFNGCTYAQACTNIRSGLCDHDCLVKLAEVTTCNDRALLQTGANYVAGCLCPVFKSGCSPLMFNAVTGGLKVGSSTCDGYVESGWYYTCGKSCSFSYPKSTTNYVLLGCFRNIFSRMNELELGFSLGGSGSAQNTGTLRILPGSATCFDLNNIELKMTSYAPGSRGITGIGFIADNTAYNCWICVVARVVNNSTGTNYSWPLALYRNRLSASVWTTNFQCLGPTAPTFTKLIEIPQNVNRNYYYNSAICSNFSNSNMVVKSIVNSSSCPYILKCDVDASISDMATCTWVNNQGYTTCTGTVTGVSLNGSAFTVTDGVASLTGFKPATASLADCATYVKRNNLAATTNANYPLVLSNAASASNKASLYSNASVTYNACTGTLASFNFQANSLSAYSPTIAGQSSNIDIYTCYKAADSSMQVRTHTFCGLNGFMYGNVCGNICGDAQNAKAISRNSAVANTTYDLLLTNGRSAADCTNVYVSSGSNCTLKYDTGTNTLSATNISACCVCTPNLVADNLAVNCGVNFTKPICATGACICTSAYDCCNNAPIWPTIRTDSSIRGKRWEYVHNGQCCTCVWRTAGVFGIQPMIICNKAKQCDVFAAIQDTGVIDTKRGSYGIMGNTWKYCISDYCHYYIDNIYFGIDDDYYISFRTVNTERFRVYADCTSEVDWNTDFITFNRYEDLWFGH